MRRRYPDRKHDAMSLEGWYRNVVLKQPFIHCHIRTDNAFLIGVTNVLPWTPSDMVHEIVLLCADEGRMWEAIELCRFSMEWAKRHRCSDWRISSITEHDLGPIARRLGTVTVEPHYRVRL